MRVHVCHLSGLTATGDVPKVYKPSFSAPQPRMDKWYKQWMDSLAFIIMGQCTAVLQGYRCKVTNVCHWCENMRTSVWEWRQNWTELNSYNASMLPLILVVAGHCRTHWAFIGTDGCHVPAVWHAQLVLMTVPEERGVPRNIKGFLR